MSDNKQDEKSSAVVNFEDTVSILPHNSWLVFASCFFILLAGFVWSVFGEIVTRAQGWGIVKVLPSGRHEIDVEKSARLQHIFVAMGDRVEQGDKLATLVYAIDASHHHSDGADEAENVGEPQVEAESFTLLSPVAGLVEEVSLAKGGMARPHHPIMLLIEPEKKEVEALAYFPAEQGNNFRPGMTAQISPNGVSPLQFGTISGSVARLTYAPVSKEHAMKALQNEDLVEQFFQRGVPIELELAFKQDINSVTGFEWSTGSGPPFPIKSGSIAEISVVVAEQSPISMIWSYLAGSTH